MLRRAERNQEGSGSSSRIYPEAKRISQDKAWHATPDPAAPCVWSGSEAVEHGLEKAPQLLLFELIDANGDGHVKPSEAALFLDTLLSASRREGAPPLAPLVEEIAARVCADAAAAAAATDEASKQQSLQPSEQGQQPQQEPGQGLFLTPALLGRFAAACRCSAALEEDLSLHCPFPTITLLHSTLDLATRPVQELRFQLGTLLKALLAWALLPLWVWLPPDWLRPHTTLRLVRLQFVCCLVDFTGHRLFTSWRMAAWLPPLYGVALYGGAWGVLAVFWAQHGWRAAQQAGRSGRGVSEFILALDAAEDNTFFACVLPWVLLLVMVFSSAVKLSLRDPEGVLQQARAVGELGVQDEVLQGFTNVTTKTMLAAVASATARRVSESLLLRGVRRSVLLLPPLLIAAHRLLYLLFTRRLWPREQLGLAMAIVQYVAMTMSMALSWREMTEIVLFLGEQSARMAVFSIMFEQRGAAAAGLPWINNGKPNNLRLWMQIRTHLLRANCIMLRWIEGSSAMILLCGLAALVLLAVTLLQGSLFSSTRGSTDLQIALSWAILGFITLIVMEFLVVVVAVSIGTTNIADLRRLSRAAWDLETTLSALRWPGVFGPLPPPDQLGGGSGRRPVPAAWHGSYGGGSGAHAMTHGHGCWDTRLQAHEAASPVQSLVTASSAEQTSAAGLQQQQPQQLRRLQHGHQHAAAAGDGRVSAPLGLPLASGRAASLDVFAPSVAALPSGGHAAGGSRQGSARRSQIGSCRVSGGGGGNATKAAAELPLPISLPHQATGTEPCAAASEGGRSRSGKMGPEAADGTQQAVSGGEGVQSAVGLSTQQPRAAAGAQREGAEQGLVASARHVPAGAAPATAGECGSKGSDTGIRQGGLLDHFSGPAEAVPDARATVAIDSEAAAALLRPQPPAPPPSLEELETCRLLLLRLIDVLRHSEEYLELFGVPLEPKFRSSLLSFVLTLAAAGLSAVISFLAKR